VDILQCCKMSRVCMYKARSAAMSASPHVHGRRKGEGVHIQFNFRSCSKSYTTLRISLTFLTLTPIASSRRSSRLLSTAKGRAGLATKHVSSRNTLQGGWGRGAGAGAYESAVLKQQVLLKAVPT
jgi:hypothetical protein